MAVVDVVVLCMLNKSAFVANAGYRIIVIMHRLRIMVICPTGGSV